MANPTVTVGCKLPDGLIIEFEGHRLHLRGSNSSRVFGGYGLTPGVDKAFFESWLGLYGKDYEPVKQGLIFVQSDDSRARAQANEQADVKNGFEGLDPNKPVAGVTQAEEEKGAVA